MGHRVKNPRYVHEFVDRHGKPRWYFRRAGYKRVPLPGLPWSPEFMAAYEEAMSGAAPVTVGESRTKPGSVSAAVIAYYQSEAWRAGLAPTTQAVRRAILERFREQHGERRLAILTTDHVREKILARLPTFDARKNWLKALRGLTAFSLEEKLIRLDPTLGIKLVRPRVKSSGFMTWKDEQVEQYQARHPVGTMARLALELLLNVAARRQDVFRLGRPHLRHGRISWHPSKTLRTNEQALTIRALPSFLAALGAMPPSAALTFLTNDYGLPFASAAAFGNKFADWCDEAGLKPVECADGRVRNFRAHGLRKAACRRLAHAGCTAPQIQAVSGHESLSQVQVYIKEAERERLADAALEKLGAADESATSISKLDDPVCQSVE